MDHNTQAEVMTVDGTEYTGTIIKDEKESPEYLVLIDVWLTKKGAISTKKNHVFVRTSNIAYITNA